MTSGRYGVRVRDIVSDPVVIVDEALRLRVLVALVDDVWETLKLVEELSVSVGDGFSVWVVDDDKLWLDEALWLDDIDVVPVPLPLPDEDSVRLSEAVKLNEAEVDDVTSPVAV
jgi:hypothetical protein